MNPVRFIKNQYHGVNAHLHSHWQNDGGWDGFHTNHIADLMRLMRIQLMPLGYVAEIEQSLQIRHVATPFADPNRISQSSIAVCHALTFQHRQMLNTQ